MSSSDCCSSVRRDPGKTRIVLELLKEDRDALVVIAKRTSPPDDFEESSFVGRKVIVLLDNLGDDEVALEPISWWERFSAINESDTVFIATCRDGADWERLRAHPHLESRLRNATVHTSAPQGADLTREEAAQLVGLLGLAEDALGQFDGTPGSVIDGTTPVVPLLPAGAGREVELTRVDDPIGRARGNLPALSSEFVGREAEIETIRSLLHSERLITISGPAGAGKTRLALHVGDLVRADFADGVWIAELSSYHTDALVADVVAAALGVPDGLTQSAPDGLAPFVGSKQLLLILNGCDHVSGTVVEFAGLLLDRCERLVILTTSREPLGAAGERVLELPPLGAPAGGEPSDAMSLFVSRLPETPGQGPLSDSDRSMVASICRSLGGNALAIELVATAATAGLGLLASKLGDRIGSGTGEKPGAPSAAPLRDAVELVADNVLGERERELFDRVSVFVGGFTLDAAQSIAEDAGLDRDEVPELLRHLVDQRLVVIDKLAPTTERYRMLESLRQEGRRRLADRAMLEPTERSHAAYVLVLAQEAETRRGQDGEAAWLDRLDVEIANVRAALWWAVESHQPEIGAQLGARLWWFWYQRSHFTEGRHHLDRLIVLSRAQLCSSNPVLLAELLNGAGNFAYNQGDLDRSEELHSEARDLRQAAGEHSLVAGSLNNIGLVARRRGQAERAEELFRKALAISRSYANHFWESMHLNNLGLVLEEWMEAHVEARDCQEESLNICARLGATWGTAQALSALGLLVANDGRLDEATQLLERSRRLRTEIDNPQGIAESLNGLGRIGLLARDPETAANRYREAFDLLERVGDRAGMAESLEGLGMTKIPRDAGAGTRLLGAANALRTEIGFAQPPRARREVEAALVAAKENLGSTTFDAEWRYGHDELPHEAVTLEGPSERSRAGPAESGVAARRGGPRSPSG